MKELIAEIHADAVEHGWWDDPRQFPEVVALIHSELSEALEEWREGKPEHIYYNPNNLKKPEGVVVELADAVIRIMDYCGAQGLDLEEAIRLKVEYNKTRPYRHGGKRA
jgi:NTP pyrophosphatase (non-canonical NTP hydrolase)